MEAAEQQLKRECDALLRGYARARAIGGLPLSPAEAEQIDGELKTLHETEAWLNGHEDGLARDTCRLDLNLMKQAEMGWI